MSPPSQPSFSFFSTARRTDRLTSAAMPPEASVPFLTNIKKWSPETRAVLLDGPASACEDHPQARETTRTETTSQLMNR